ncbi:uncharacterized protein N7459_006211 [Penicillium hispanicum]|uniref:uncharacterized protein n=1 Tax=Penicillium hispanicum TaxID=1080232 RepID=UPI00254111B4|nr:uncharacterized protein N7459_006211 [Penicillium hispanicum]KAJ5580226.1 hypothetical protein N7459_006211 [Penicillium hispanicum]
MPHKRRRPILSCYGCRSRKIKCDRAHPCTHCKRAGRADTCIFDYPKDRNTPPATPEETPITAADAAARNVRTRSPRQTQPSSLDYLSTQSFQHNDAEIHSYVKSAGAPPFSTEKYLGVAHPAGAGASTKNSGPQSFGDFLRAGQAFQTHYFGPSNPAGLLLQWEELPTFIRRALAHVPATTSSMGDKIQQPRKKTRVDARPDKETLLSSLPPRVHADRLVQVYLNLFENTYRVLHVPTFLWRYGCLWDLPEISTEITLVHTLLVLATANCFASTSEEGFVGRSPTARKRSKLSIRTAEAWLAAQSHKHLFLDHLQAHVLLFLAKKANCMERRRGWTSIGAVARLAMTVALHREPTALQRNITIFEAEMRRRLWHTILELEIQEASDRGMQPLIDAETWDCRAPSNVDDESFHEMSESAPAAKPLTQFSRTSFLCAMQEHYPLRVEILKKINSVRNPVDPAAAQDYIRHLQAVATRASELSWDSASGIPKALYKLVLYEQMMILQQQVTIQSSSHPHSRHFRVLRRQTALLALQAYRSLPLDEAVQLFNFRGDGFRAVLSICHEIVRSADGPDDVAHNTEVEMKLLEHMVQIMYDRVTRLGQGFQMYWLTSAAFHLVKARSSRQDSEEAMAAETADGAVRLLDQISPRRNASVACVSEAGSGALSIASMGYASERNQMQSLWEFADNLDLFDSVADFDPSGGGVLGCDIESFLG